MIDVDIGTALDRKMDPEPARVSGKMLRTRLADNNTRGRHRRVNIAQAFPLLEDATFDCIGAPNAFEDNLNRSVHAMRLFVGGRRHDGTGLKIEFVEVL